MVSKYKYMFKTCVAKNFFSKNDNLSHLILPMQNQNTHTNLESNLYYGYYQSRPRCFLAFGSYKYVQTYILLYIAIETIILLLFGNYVVPKWILS